MGYYPCRSILLLFFFFLAVVVLNSSDVQCARDTIGKASGPKKQSKKTAEKVIYKYINKGYNNPTNQGFQDAEGLYHYVRPIYGHPVYAQPIYVGSRGGYAQPIYAGGGGGYAQPVYAGGGGYAQPGMCPLATCCEGGTSYCWCC